MYAELNRLLMGLGHIPLNTELQQDDRTVCCRHTVVVQVLHYYSHVGTAAADSAVVPFELDVQWD